MPLPTTQDIISSLQLSGLTHAKIGEAVGVHSVSVARWTSGRQTPSAEDYRRLHDLHERQCGRGKKARRRK